MLNVIMLPHSLTLRLNFRKPIRIIMIASTGSDFQTILSYISASISLMIRKETGYDVRRE